MSEKFASAADAAMKRVQRDIEAQLFGVSTSTAPRWEDQPPLTVARIQEMVDALPPRETWVVGDIFPAGVATVFRTPGENLTCLSPGTWDRFRLEWRKVATVERLDSSTSLFSINPVFLDECNARERKRITDLIVGTLAATIQLQDIMRAWWHRLPPA